MITQMPAPQSNMLTQEPITETQDVDAAMGQFYQSLLDQGYSETEIAEIMQLAQLQAQQEGMAGQLASAEAQAQTPAPPGLQGPMLYTAASPLEHIANTIQAYRGHQAIPGLRQQQQALRDQETNALLMLLRQK